MKSPLIRVDQNASQQEHIGRSRILTLDLLRFSRSSQKLFPEWVNRFGWRLGCATKQATQHLHGFLFAAALFASAGCQECSIASGRLPFRISPDPPWTGTWPGGEPSWETSIVFVPETGSIARIA